MQYELRLREEREAGKREGKQEEKVGNIRLFMQNANLSADKVMQILQVPEKEQELYLRLVNDPAFYKEYFSETEDDYNEEEHEDEEDLEEE